MELVTTLKADVKVRCKSGSLPLQFRFLNTGDIDEIKALCKHCFPLTYPHYWFTLITSDYRFFSLAAVLNGKIVGMLVAEVKCKCQVQGELGSSILASSFGPDTPVAYILSLGVHPCYRRRGIATQLLTKFLGEMSAGNPQMQVKAVYLHVLATNLSAIRFYLGHNFERWNYLKAYYVIDGRPCDGFSYVLYVNGGRRPWSYSELIMNMVSAVQDLQPCKFSIRLFWWFCNFVSSSLPLGSRISPVLRQPKSCHDL